MNFLQIMCVFLHQLDYGCVSHFHPLISARLKLGLPQLLLMSASAILLVCSGLWMPPLFSLVVFKAKCFFVLSAYST